MEQKGISGIVIALIAAVAGYYFGYDRGHQQSVVAVTATATPIPANEGSSVVSVVEDVRVTAALQQMIGVWQSGEDPHFQTEFKEYGMQVDSYNGEEQTHVDGTWSLFTAETSEATSFQLNNEDVYLKQIMPSGVAYFRITKITPDELEMINMDRGGALRFAKLR